MSKDEIKVPRKVVNAAIIVLVILAILLLSRGQLAFLGFAGSADATNSASNLTAGSAEKFALLSGQGGQRSVGSTCGLQTVSVETMPDDARIQGSCCGPMDFHHYQEQVEGVKKYADIPQIPSDPYDVPVSLAKQLFGYQTTIQLTADQQAIYDEAMQISEEGGPCCCRCWRWTAFEGQAKYLISELNWSAGQIAEVWDLEDGCGGAGDEHN